LIYAPGIGNTGVGNNFITVNDLIAAANTSLGVNGNTVASGPIRSYQNALEIVLDNGNNDRSIYVQPTPCKISF
jgi:hypothetical protein